MSAAADPLVSVVIATYNRADIIGYAVRSALLNRDVALEVIVIGDGCTDATPEAIAAIGDARVRFVNLPQNWGEQSVPSNEGIALARGEFVAFLNHDDLFLPWHLPDLVAAHRDGADVTWSPYLVVSPSDEPTHVRPKYALAAVTPEARFEPLTFVVASATCYRKRVLEHVGGWTRASQTILSPSQDLLFKAYRAGFDIRRTERPSALVFYTGDRKETYVKRSSSEHAWFFDLVDAGGEALFLELMRAGVHDAAARNETPLARFVLVRWYRRVSSLALRLFGLHPHVPIMWLRYGLRRGGLVNRAREIAGLPHIDFRVREKQMTRGVNATRSLVGRRSLTSEHVARTHPADFGLGPAVAAQLETHALAADEPERAAAALACGALREELVDRARAAQSGFGLNGCFPLRQRRCRLRNRLFIGLASVGFAPPRAQR